MNEELIKRLRTYPKCEQSEVENWLADWCGEAADALELADKRIAELEAQLSECQKDAERYRWLRNECDYTDSTGARIVNNYYGLEWDVVIDAAIKESEK
jgi:hypothetical protein